MRSLKDFIVRPSEVDLEGSDEEVRSDKLWPGCRSARARAILPGAPYGSRARDASGCQEWPRHLGRLPVASSWTSSGLKEG